MFDELAALAEALRTLGDLTPRSLDAIASLGEQLSSVLVVAAFRAHGLPAEHVDARQVMITDAQYTRAEPQPDASVLGGYSPRSATCSTTGPSNPAKCTPSPTSSSGTGGKTARPQPAGRCS